MFSSLITLYIASLISPSMETLAQSSPMNFNFPQEVETYSIPIKNQQYISPIIDASSAIVEDLKTGDSLFEKKAHGRLQMASITKLMTLSIALEENKLEDVVTVSRNAVAIGGSMMGLRNKEQISLQNLVYGALIGSANDAAVALAEHNAETVTKFVEKMNNKAKLLGLVNTHFENPVGLDNSNNYSSAYDLAKLARYVYQNPIIKEAATIKELEVKSVDGKYTHKLESTNELLGSYLRIKGLKTGKTQGAGECLIAIAENDKGNEIITVILNSRDRFKETKILVDWIFRAYNW